MHGQRDGCRLSIITSAMHNIIASEQSGVECACVCVLRVVQNCIVANYVERYGMCSARIDINSRSDD